MSVTKNKDKNYWEVQFYYKDYTGKRIKKHKRGFKTKKEAQEWENEFKKKEAKDLTMTFKAFVELYFEDIQHRLKESTIITKKYIVDDKLMPYFGSKKMSDISVADIRKWQAELMAREKGYSKTYLKTINNQLNAIMNYAVQYYDLSKNPCRQAGSMGKGSADEMEFWTREEFEKFLVGVEDKPMSKMAFLVLYWTGLRIGELLALTMGDIDFDNNIINISKSYQRINKKDIVTDTKTDNGMRNIHIPQFLADELRTYCNKLYGIDERQRIFQCSKHYLEHEMIRGVNATEVKKIRLHDLRHSHASLLISEMNIQPLLVAKRLGHGKIQTTLNTYSHLFPNKNKEVADELDRYYKEGNKDER